MLEYCEERSPLCLRLSFPPILQHSITPPFLAPPWRPIIEPILRAIDLQKTYLRTKALDKVTVSVNRGESVALVGANGAGKSTLLDIILGLVEPDPPPEGGSCIVFGVAPGKIPPAIRCRIGCIADSAHPIPWASLRSLGGLYRALFPKWDQPRYESLLARWNLDISSSFGSFSQGQMRLAEFALTLSFHPDLLVLDEPFNNLDPLMRRNVQQLLHEDRAAGGTTILYSTHILTEVSQIAERVVILDKGKIIRDARLADLERGVEETFLAVGSGRN